ncbi:MAG: hypothetical protein OEY93_11080 [Anaerolineae bacterium]|nr:hypothetical protein [Anaerolineae bacterium]
MKIIVRLAEPFWRPTGEREHQFELKEPARARDLLDRLVAAFPALAEEFRQSPPLIFLEDEEISLEDLLLEGQRVHLVWPVAGG